MAVLAPLLEGRAAPTRPTDPAQVLERVAPRRGADWEAIRGLRDRLEVQPDDAMAAAELATRYAALAQRDGEPRYVGWAEAALARWWDATDAPVPSLKARARVLQARHDFAAARADLERALVRAPRDADAWLSYAGIALVQGDLAAARAACARVVLLADLPTAMVCAAQVAGAAGREREAAALLEPSLRDGAPAEVGLRRWALTTLGELKARAGDAAGAERAFRAALDLGDPDIYLLAAYADLLLERRREADALALLDDRPAADALLLRRAIAMRRLGHRDAPRLADRLTARFEALRARGDATHAREEALFALHVAGQPSRAVRLAAENFARQREPADLRLLVDAAVAAGRPELAAPAFAWLRDQGVAEAVIARLERRAGLGS
jgi:Tfp pilus assembly protein PilF